MKKVSLFIVVIIGFLLVASTTTMAQPGPGRGGNPPGGHGKGGPAPGGGGGDRRGADALGALAIIAGAVVAEEVIKHVISQEKATDEARYRSLVGPPRGRGPVRFRGQKCFPEGAFFPNGAILLDARGREVARINPGVNIPSGECLY